jgi:signal transduction histidine kinase/CheY-like chemotaxis protein
VSIVTSSWPGLPEAGKRAEEIQAEQLKVIYRHLPPLLVINLLVASGLVFGLWEVVSHDRLVAWLTAMLVMIAARTWLYLAYRRSAADPSRRLWRIGFTIGSAAAGSLWGISGAWLFPPDSLQYQLFVLFILVGMGAGAVSSLTAYMPAFYAYLPVSMAPITVMLFRVSDPFHLVLGALAVVYVAGLSFFARTINKAFVESLSLRFQNVDLVRELSEQRDAAERANVGKSKFLAAASHDLRQPLHALTLFTSALDERIKYPEVRRVVDNINASVRALETLFNTLLDISRLDAGVWQPEFRDFRLDDMRERLLNDYAPEAQAKELSLKCDACDAVIRSDPALLERILRNYISNAIRYTEKGEVRVICRTVNDSLRIEVVDSGIGIPAAHHRQIFSEFHQLGNPERDRAKGLGLGLAIVERVARILDHPIDLESTPGKGSCFSVTVPLGDPVRVARQDPSSVADALQDLTGMCIAIVDDEISVREGMRTLLEQWGCRVAGAGSEDEVVATLMDWNDAPDVIIVDYRLRDERTGVEAIDRLRREFGKSIPALIVTGDTAPERLREAKASGHPLVHKPIQPAALRTFLRNTRNKAPIA